MRESLRAVFLAGLGILALLALAASAGPEPATPVARAQTILHMLDYVAVDYPEAVQGGRVKDAAEYQEQVDFVTQAIAMLGELPARPEQAALIAEARRLLALVEGKRSAEEVARLSGEIRRGVIVAYKVSVAPARPPDVRAASALYAVRCAACHGPGGRGDGPAAKGLDPAPTNFHDHARLDRRSAHALYNAITLGVPGTAMAAFADLSDDQRWALAVHVAGLADGEAARARGTALWAEGRGRAVIGDLAGLVTVTTAEIQTRHGDDGVAVLAALRADPARLAPAGGEAIAVSTRLLGESLEAYRRGRPREAQDLAVASYLEGFEPVEAALDARDRTLRGLVEQEMIRYRTLLRDGAPAADVEAQAGKIQDLLADVQRLLAGRGLAAGPAFVSAFVILLREGLEAVLIVAAIVAMLVRADRRDALPAVHTGWLAALALGVVTWGVAAYVVTISGATREVTEGITALASAGILLWVGFWMHDKSHAQRWQAYLQSRLQGALGRQGVWGLALVSFLAVYREVFETVLFSQALWLQIEPGSRYALVGGLGAAAIALAVMSWLIVRGSLRMPLGAFFGITSMALAALSIVLAGKGVAALEEAGYLSPRPIDVPSVPLLGVYPDLLGLALQVALAVVVVGGFAWRSRAVRRAG